MKKLLTQLLALPLLLASYLPLVYGANDNHDPHTITLVADEWCPYNCALENNQKGYMLDIAKAVFEPLGYTIDYKIVPWSRAIKHTLSGRYDGAIGATKEELPNAIFHTPPLGYSANHFITRNDSSWSYNDIESLMDIRLAVIQDYDYGKAINQYLSHRKDSRNVFSITGNGIAKKCLKLLLRNRIDVYLEDKNVAFYQAKQLNILGHIKSAGHDDANLALYIAFSPQSPHSSKYAQILSEGIHSLRYSGHLARILNNYGLSDWKTIP